MKEEYSNLYFKEGSSDKVYEVALIKSGKGWLVNYAYGRRGSSLTSGSKTAGPIDYAMAKSIYDVLVRSKTSKGYKSATPTTAKKFKVLPRAGSTEPVLGEDTEVRPQLLNPIEESHAIKLLSDDGWLAQEKYDGRRRLLFGGDHPKGTNRKGLTVGITKALMKVLMHYPEGTILDGEDLGNKIVIFDMINLDMKYIDRYMKLMEMWVPAAGLLELADTAGTEASKQAMLQKLYIDKAEGIVFKNANAKYTPGRPASGGNQLKFKFVESASCIVSHINEKTRSVKVCVLDTSSKPFRQVEVGNVTIYPNQEIPKLAAIVEVKYLYYFPGGSLYQPVYLGERDDLTVFDCTLEKLKTKKETPVEEEA